jgi:hypothetical protein
MANLSSDLVSMAAIWSRAETGSDRNVIGGPACGGGFFWEERV